MDGVAYAPVCGITYTVALAMLPDAAAISASTERPLYVQALVADMWVLLTNMSRPGAGAQPTKCL